MYAALADADRQILVPTFVLVLGVVIGAFAFVARMNAKAVTNQLTPHRDRIASALPDLEHPSDEAMNPDPDKAATPSMDTNGPPPPHQSSS